jgi:predicted regulator of Ras-like GTPase activity (Roadblock/LC7/MglB family)
MFNLFRSVFGRSQTAEAVSKPATVSLPASRAQQARANDNGGTTEILEAHGGTDEVVHIPLDAVKDFFPDPIRPQIRKTFGKSVEMAIPVRRLREQLKKGAVRFSFKELKSFLPEDGFSSNGSLDEMQVSLPLAEVVKRLKSDHLGRRPSQRQMSIPEEGSLVFSASVPANGTSRSTPPATDTPVANIPAEPETPPAVEMPPSPPPAPVAALNLPLPEAKPISAEPVTPKAVNGTPRSDGVLTIPLPQAISKWPETVRLFLTESLPHSSQLRIPISEIEPGIRRGKLAFPWKTIRDWIVPPLQKGFGEHDSEMLELPLAVVAPAFMSLHRNGTPVEKAVVPDFIPDLFSATAPAKAEKASAPVSFPAHPEPAPLPQAGISQSVSLTPPAEVLAVKSSGAAAVTSAAASRKPVEPVEIVSRACALPGILGALIATTDGLLVAASLPSDLVAESLAAFVPQMHQKAAQYTAELGMGQPGQLTISLPGRVLVIVSASRGYLAVLGRKGEPLPETQLQTLAGHLNRSTTVKE